MYSEQEKKYFIKREQEDAKGNIKIIKRDFYDDLPRAVCEVLDNISWRWRNYDWFEEAWNKYRDHIINASASGLAIKAPGFVFNDYIDEQVKQDFLNREGAEILHSDLYLDELFHHGIKGQRWGVRRFQNEDGSLTEAGKARYNDDGSPKDPRDMTDEDLAKSSKRLSAESTYANLTGRSQPSKALTRDTAIKIGATFVGTFLMTFLARKWKKGTFFDWNVDKANKPTTINAGKTILTGLLAGGIGALVAGTSSLGGSAAKDLPDDPKNP